MGLGVALLAPQALGAQASGLALGQRIYREGILSDGTAMTARVAGDVPMDGRMFSCVNCHRRSGLGSEEGTIITWPINGPSLFEPRRRTGAWRAKLALHGPGAAERWTLPPALQAKEARPAYTEETLARALREGLDPLGRALNPAMPRFELPERDMKLLIAYLRQLSFEPDPGVDEGRLRFATVVSEGVPERDREAMMAVLEATIVARNTQTRPHLRRKTQGPVIKTEKYSAYRMLDLDVWTLRGPRETWGAQLRAYASTRPVFATLGGMVEGDWGPVHDFCEQERLPCLFPITDRPPDRPHDWYTLYFTRGFAQEADALLGDLRSDEGGAQDILQVYRAGGAGAELADAVRRGLSPAEAATEGSIVLPEAGDWDAAAVLEALSAAAPRSVLVWLNAADLDALYRQLADTPVCEDWPVYASWTLLDRQLSAVPEAERARTRVTYPRDLPASAARKHAVLRQWMKARDIPNLDEDIQGRLYFLGWMLPAALTHLRSEFYRDYLLESFDMMRDQDYAIPVFPRLSFGPGQRAAAKGCYVVELGPGDDPEVVARTGWVSHELPTGGAP